MSQIYFSTSIAAFRDTYCFITFLNIFKERRLSALFPFVRKRAAKLQPILTLPNVFENFSEFFFSVIFVGILEARRAKNRATKLQPFSKPPNLF
jgi:hypothetical protein